MKQVLTSLFMLAVMQLTAQQSVISQRSTAQGFGITANVGFLSVTCDDLAIESETGINLGIGASYGFSELFELFLQYQTAPSVKNKAEGGVDYSFSSGDVGVRFNFGSTLTEIRPYLDASYGVVSLKAPLELYDIFGNFLGEFDYTASGGHFSFGGGVAYYPSIPFSIKLDVHFSPGVFTEEELEGEQPVEVESDVSTLRINVGGTYRF